MRDVIQKEIDEQQQHLEALRVQIVQTDAGIQALQWVLKKADELQKPEEPADAS